MYFISFFRSSFIASLGSAVASTPIDVIRVIIEKKILIFRQMSIDWFINNISNGWQHSQTRLMNQKKIIKTTSTCDTQAMRLYRGSIDCGIQTVRNEGLLALYKGFIPTWFRMGPWNIIFFITYEQLKQFH